MTIAVISLPEMWHPPADGGWEPYRVLRTPTDPYSCVYNGNAPGGVGTSFNV